MDITGLSAVFNFGSKILDKVFPNPEDKAKAMLELEKLKQSGELAQLAADTDLMKGQMEINKTEATSSNLFIAGWRPFIGWICGVALLYHFILQPFFAFVLANTGHTVVLPTFDIDSLYTILMGMLGLGVMRSVEKVKKVNKY